ncbi:hypothetical protein BRARA_I04398 [Brassica rapa]|uniref:MADS-box domain-containing protein n=1 Tax=Brassica campestris TaxID=3711 RepID=A0A397YD73_BRACM|nr:hypothetical protein BRARA_I04398 [Brassica rapa]
MGRKKIELKKIECPKEKSSKFSKRKKGLLKKAEEMAVLCDSDIILLVFSPTSKPNLFYPHSRDEVQLQEDDKVIELGEARELLDENTSILR